MQIILVAGLLGLALAQDLSSLPTCALSCVSNAITATGCNAADAACICNNQSFLSSITSCIVQARENARGLRDRIPSEMWECINTAYHALCFDTEQMLDNDDLHGFCVAVRDASHHFHGISAATQ